MISMKRLPLLGNTYEVLAAIGKLPNNTRKLVVITAYIPPATKAKTWLDISEFLISNIHRLKADMNDPYVVLTGDFNKRPVTDILTAVPDLKNNPSTPKQGNGAPGPDAHELPG